MKLFVGLGNPGTKYQNTRHNIGFRAVERIAYDYDFSNWRSKFQGQISEGRLLNKRVTLLKPETYMNNSGQSVGAALRFLKLAATDVYVFHDELDLAPKRLRSKQAGGHAGHNGLRSLHAHIGSEYHRIRIGIGHPGDKAQVSHYVLDEFKRSDLEWIENILQILSKAAPDLARGKANAVETLMSKENN